MAHRIYEFTRWSEKQQNSNFIQTQTQKTHSRKSVLHSRTGIMTSSGSWTLFTESRRLSPLQHSSQTGPDCNYWVVTIQNSAIYALVSRGHVSVILRVNTSPSWTTNATHTTNGVVHPQGLVGRQESWLLADFFCGSWSPASASFTHGNGDGSLTLHSSQTGPPIGKYKTTLTLAWWAEAMPQ